MVELIVNKTKYLKKVFVTFLISIVVCLFLWQCFLLFKMNKDEWIDYDTECLPGTVEKSYVSSQPCPKYAMCKLAVYRCCSPVLFFWAKPQNDGDLIPLP